MSKKPDRMRWGKFYWGDFLADPKLKICSLEAQGLWMRMLCIAAEANPVGYVVIEGNTLGAAELASECGKPLAAVETALAELARWGVYSTDRKGRIYSRRMIKDAKKAKNARQNGKTGGNPSLGKDKGNPPLDNPQVKPEDNTQRLEARSQKVDKNSEDKSSDGRAVVVEIDPDKKAWALAVEVLCVQGRTTQTSARTFFGKLLSECGLQAKELLPALAKALEIQTQDPRAYLRQAAAQIAKRRDASGPGKRVAFV